MPHDERLQAFRCEGRIEARLYGRREVVVLRPEAQGALGRAHSEEGRIHLPYEYGLLAGQFPYEAIEGEPEEIDYQDVGIVCVYSLKERRLPPEFRPEPLLVLRVYSFYSYALPLGQAGKRRTNAEYLIVPIQARPAYGVGYGQALYYMAGAGSSAGVEK